MLQNVLESSVLHQHDYNKCDVEAEIKSTYLWKFQPHLCFLNTFYKSK